MGGERMLFLAGGCLAGHGGSRCGRLHLRILRTYVEPMMLAVLLLH